MHNGWLINGTLLNCLSCIKGYESTAHYIEDKVFAKTLWIMHDQSSSNS